MTHKLPLEEPLPPGHMRAEVRYLDECPVCGKEDMESSPRFREVCNKCYSDFNKSNFLLVEDWLIKRLLKSKSSPKTREQMDRANSLKRKARKRDKINVKRLTLESSAICNDASKELLQNL